jgi:hypothetical protein
MSINQAQTDPGDSDKLSTAEALVDVWLSALLAVMSSPAWPIDGSAVSVFLWSEIGGRNFFIHVSLSMLVLWDVFINVSLSVLVLSALNYVETASQA